MTDRPVPTNHLTINIMVTLTVRDLATLCSKAIMAGHGNKKILIPCEPNAFHGLFQGLIIIPHGSLDGKDLPGAVSPEVAEKDYLILA